MNELSKRENEVVTLLLEGKSNKQIASALHITTSTVEFHLKNIYEKYQVSSRTELVIKLGKSTVAGEGDSADNRARPNLSNWSTSLKQAVLKFGRELSMDNTMSNSARGTGNTMTFFESVRVCLVKYADFEGRASRSEFWWFALAVLLVSTALAYLSETAASIFMIAVLLPFLAAGARRLRDTGRSAWWLLFLLVPIAGIITLGIYWSQPGVSGEAEPVSQ